ncbi:hypothetical protein BDV19DRAFT_361500 [Aspergillus venezuelensis]
MTVYREEMEMTKNANLRTEMMYRTLQSTKTYSIIYTNIGSLPLSAFFMLLVARHLNQPLNIPTAPESSQASFSPNRLTLQNA